MQKNARERRSIGRQVEGVLARAALLRLIAQGFGYPAAGAAAAMCEGFARLDCVRERRGTFPSELGASIERAQRAWCEATDDGLEREYMRLFHSAGPVSLRETAYGDGRRPAGRPVDLADVGGFYAAFGVNPSDDNPNMPDHVGIETEFVSLLLLKEAYALEGGLRSQRQVTRKAARAFLQDHLGRWTPALRARLDEENASPPFGTLAVMLSEIISAECRRLRARPSLVEGPAPTDDMQAETFVCPLAEKHVPAPDDRAPWESGPPKI